jgi:threonine/homoserine/homoserine lactone efflux protein
VVPFGAAASPDLTILPIFLAASAVGAGAVFGVLATFSLVTLTTFVGLTVAATLAGYQVKGEWLEENANTITGFVLMAIGAAVYLSVF